MAQAPLTPAAIFLRLGITLVAFLWLVVHLSLVAAVPSLKCSGDTPDIWQLTFYMAPLTFVFSLLLLVSEPLKSVVQVLRWGCILLFVLCPLALLGALPIFSATTLGGAPICPGVSAYSNLVWQQGWGPVQLGLILMIAIQATRYWMMAGRQAEAARLGQN